MPVREDDIKRFVSWLTTLTGCFRIWGTKQSQVSTEWAVLCATSFEPYELVISDGFEVKSWIEAQMPQGESMHSCWLLDSAVPLHAGPAERTSRPVIMPAHASLSTMACRCPAASISMTMPLLWSRTIGRCKDQVPSAQCLL